MSYVFPKDSPGGIHPPPRMAKNGVWERHLDMSAGVYTGVSGAGPCLPVPGGCVVN